MALFFSGSRVQVSHSQELPDETLSGLYYVRQIPQLAGKTEHFIAYAFLVVTEISSVCELITKPKNSKVVFQFDLFFGARMGVAPGSPGPKSRT